MCFFHMTTMTVETQNATQRMSCPVPTDEMSPEKSMLHPVRLLSTSLWLLIDQPQKRSVGLKRHLNKMVSLHNFQVCLLPAQMQPFFHVRLSQNHSRFGLAQGEMKLGSYPLESKQSSNLLQTNSKELSISRLSEYINCLE